MMHKTTVSTGSTQRFGGLRLGMLAAAVMCTAVLSGCSTIPAENRAMNQRELGIAAFNRGEYALAHSHFLASVEAKPTGFRQHYWLGRTELVMGRPITAQSKFEYAWTLRQGDPEYTPLILDGIAEAIFQQDRRDALVTFLSDVSSRYGTTADYLREANYLVKIGDPDNAVVAFRKAARFSSRQDPAAYIAISDFYESINDVPNAIKSLRYAYYIAPTDPGIADRFRKFGIVPGPTLRLEPPKPDLLVE